MGFYTGMITRLISPDLATAPKHFHNGSESQVEESPLSDDPAAALKEFLNFVRASLIEFSA